MTGGSTNIAGAAGGTALVTIFDQASDGGGCIAFGVENISTSAGPVYVLITDMHETGEPFPISPGLFIEFKRFSLGGISTVKVYGDGSGSATARFGVTGKP